MTAHIRDEWPNYGGDLDPVVWARVRAAMRHEEGDRVPIWDYMDNNAVMEHFKQPGDTYDEAMVRVYHGLGIDFCRGYGRSYSETDDGRENAEHTSKVSGRTEWRTKFPIETLEDLKNYNYRLITDADCAKWLEHVQAAQARLAPLSYYVPGAGVGFDEVYSGMTGPAFFSYALYDAPKDVAALLEKTNYNAVKIAETAAKAKPGPIYFTWSDIAYKNRLLFSPKVMRELFIPMLRRVCEPLKNAGLTVIFHSDGDVSEILDEMVDAGIDGLNPIEPLAGMDIGAIRKRYGKRLILVGNLDCSQLLPLGSPDEIRSAVKETLRVAGKGGGLFIGSSSEIVPATPLENVLAFYEACREYGKFPLKV